jgi:hypothetical protein
MPPPKIDDYLRRGYLPENLPPSFGSGFIADYFAQNVQADYVSEAKNAVQSAVYSASKRGMTRRNFAVMHPATGYDLARFADEHGEAIWARMKTSAYSLSVPEPKDGSDRALDIPSHSELERVRLERLSRFRFVAKTDVSRFYHSIYTHSVPWAFHSKLEAKADRDPKSKKLPFNRLDYILRCGQDGQTIGVPVGPDVSRLVAEGLFAAIDEEFQKRCTITDCDVIRHVDDIWIGANSHAHAEEALWRYREAIRAFELDINEAKTHIYSADFRFTDSWPTDISEKIDYALDSEKRVEERLRTALEYAFKLTSSGNDDGVAKFVIRYLDQSGCMTTHWDTVEPYLKRNAVHFGHSLDYVSRILVWKKLTGGGLDESKWSDILLSSLGKHGRLGNDSEVCWTLYATEKLGIVVDDDVTRSIIENCGALSLTAALNLADMNLAGSTAFDAAKEVLSSEDGSGAFWPTILEWKSRGWAGHDQIESGNEIITGLVEAKVTLFARASVPKVFQGISAAKFASILQAIEHRVSAYDDDDPSDVFDDMTDDDDPLG